VTWNYRIVRHVDSRGNVCYRIHEAYSEAGEVVTIAQGPSSPSGETPEELAEDLDLMRQALRHPVLNFDDY
jgi:hypothetical protein